MQFEPILQSNIDSELKNIGKLFHITTEENLNNICQDGYFKPLSQNNIFLYPNRVYFLKGNAPNKFIINLAFRLFKTSKNDINDYGIIIVDIGKISEEILFFYDPNFEYSVFTEQKISTDCIIDTIHISNFAK